MTEPLFKCKVGFCLGSCLEITETLQSTGKGQVPKAMVHLSAHVEEAWGCTHDEENPSSSADGWMAAPLLLFRCVPF